MYRVARVSSIGLFCLAACQIPAAAAPVTLQFDGVVGEVWGAITVLFPDIVPGTQFTAVVNYDTQAADTDPNPNYGAYEQSPGQSSLVIELGGITFASKSGSSSLSLVRNDTLIDPVVGMPPYPPGDLFYLNWNDLLGPTPDYDLAVDITLKDHTASAFSNDYLPTSLESAAFDGMTINISGNRSEVLPYSLFYVELLPQTISLIPEPSAFALAAIGDLALAVCAVRRRFA